MYHYRGIIVYKEIGLLTTNVKNKSLLTLQLTMLYHINMTSQFNSWTNILIKNSVIHKHYKQKFRSSIDYVIHML